jgi:hypothetical protein
VVYLHMCHVNCNTRYLKPTVLMEDKDDLCCVLNVCTTS